MSLIRLRRRIEARLPVDQMSTGFPWPVFLMTSGATYPKEPAREVSCSPGEWRSLASSKNISHSVSPSLTQYVFSLPISDR